MPYRHSKSVVFSSLGEPASSIRDRVCVYGSNDGSLCELSRKNAERSKGSRKFSDLDGLLDQIFVQ